MRCLAFAGLALASSYLPAADVRGAGAAPVVLPKIEVTARRDESLARLVGAAAVLSLAREGTVTDGVRNLGDALSNLPGIDTTSFGPAVGRPVVRGFSGQRVRILSDGIGTGDASAVSPDHAVSLDPRLLRSVEIVRGPATLLYGNAAVGGAVNVATRILPESFSERGSRSIVEGEYGSADRGRTGFAAWEIGDATWSLGLNAVLRETDDLSIPGLARRTDVPPGHSHGNGTLTAEPNPDGILPNSAQHAKTYSLGATFRPKRNRFAAGLVAYDTRYGVPFHSHADSTNTASTDVKNAEIDLHQWRAIAEADVDLGSRLLHSFHFRYAYTDYKHSEREGFRASSDFAIETHEFRGEFFTDGDSSTAWDAALGFQGSYETFRSATSADLAGVIFPATETSNVAVFAVARRRFGPVTLRSGVRYETQAARLADFSGYAQAYKTPSWSASAALNLPRRSTLELGVTRFNRAPSSSEIFANGSHLSSGIFERGSLFQFPSTFLETECGTGVEAALQHKDTGWSATLTAYWQDFDRYIFLRRTEYTDDLSGLPIFEHLARPAQVHGGEFEMMLDFGKWGGPPVQLRAVADYVQARFQKDDLGETNPLPRIPPASYRLVADYSVGRWSFWAGSTRKQPQPRAELNSETTTPGYLLLDAGIRHTRTWGTRAVTAALACSNLTDQDARNHSSFLKDVAPLPARGFVVTIHTEW